MSEFTLTLADASIDLFGERARTEDQPQRSQHTGNESFNCVDGCGLPKASMRLTVDVLDRLILERRLGAGSLDNVRTIPRRSAKWPQEYRFLRTKNSRYEQRMPRVRRKTNEQRNEVASDGYMPENEWGPLR
jgi:hypothetical protein